MNLEKIDAQRILTIILQYLPKMINVSESAEMVQMLCAMSRDLVGAERSSLWFIDHEQQEIALRAADGIEGIRLPLGTGVLGHAIAQGEAVIVNNPYEDERFFQEIDRKTGFITRNLVVVPVRNSDGEVIGAFEVVNKNDPSGFTATDLAVLSITVSITGKLLESLGVHDTLETIFRFAARIAKESSIDRLLLLLADLARDIVQADRSTIWLVDRERDELWTKTAHGLHSVRIPVHSGLVGHAVATNAPVICNDPASDARFNPEVDAQTGYRTKSAIAVPIKTLQDEVIGAMQCVNKKSLSRDFKGNDLQKMMLVGGYAAQTLEVAGLYKEIEDTQREVVFTLGTACEFRSKETSNHVRRVAEYSAFLAYECGMSIEEVELIRQASPLHDIGKIAIPDAILNKPGKLTADEFDVMKTHTRIAYDMLHVSERKILKTAAIIASEHHEKWDGSGYPRGRAGDDIHMYGRITAVADVFDALGSDRCYKKAWEMDAILDLFRQQRGLHFDPKLVDLFLSNLSAFLYIRDQYRD